MLIEIIIVDSSKTKESINKNDKKYLSSLISFFLKRENISQTTSLKSRSQSSSEQLQLSETAFTFFFQAVFTRSHYFRTLLDEENVLSKNSTRFRKFNLRRQAYLIALKEALINEKQAYYESFMISMKKKKRSHRDELSSELKYYQQMLKHSEISDFLRIMNIEIQTL